MNYSRIKDLCREQGIFCEENHVLAPHTSIKIGGACDLFVSVTDEAQLCGVLRICRSDNVPYFILGRGSNLLVSSQGYRGCVVMLAPVNGSVRVSGNTLTAWAGASLGSLCVAALDNSLTGLEFAYGIPGSAGGALFMNAGAYGGEMKQVIKSCRYIDECGELREMAAGEMQLSYRSSVFQKRELVITSLTLELSFGENHAIKAKMDELMQKRRDKQPLEYPSCGSTFKRPEGYFAAALIEECGLKGFSCGGAEVSRKHSGFVINRSSATYEDVMTVVEEVQRVVLDKKGVLLECEMVILK